jgi:resuscitation-promoting factor RpfB
VRAALAVLAIVATSCAPPVDRGAAPVGSRGEVSVRTAPPMPARTEDVEHVEATTGPDGRDPASARELARELVAGLGWHDGPEWDCLDQLWELESRWDYTAQGPTDDHGIPQAHAPAHPDTDTDEWRNDPAAQIEFGRDYIAGRYGTPCSALNTWHSRARKDGRGGWY